MTITAYLRVSTDKQTCLNQKYEIENYCKHHNLQVNRWVKETISSRQNLEKRKLNNILKSVKENDVIIATEISRFGRNLLEIMNILQICLNSGCKIITIKENYHLGNDIQSKVLAFAFGLTAEIERQLISQRTKECLKRLKEEGKHLGRPFGFKYSKLNKNKLTIKNLLQQKISKNQISKLMNCSYTTLYRFLKNNNILF